MLGNKSFVAWCGDAIKEPLWGQAFGGQFVGRGGRHHGDRLLVQPAEIGTAWGVRDRAVTNQANIEATLQRLKEAAEKA